jgi:hypothetical protein
VHKDKIAVRFDATDEYDILAKVSFFYPIPVLLGRYSWAILVSSLLGRLEIDRLVQHRLTTWLSQSWSLGRWFTLCACIDSLLHYVALVAQVVVDALLPCCSNL